MVEFVQACCDGDIDSATQVLNATLLTPDDVAKFVTSVHPSDYYSLLYRLLVCHTAWRHNNTVDNTKNTKYIDTDNLMSCQVIYPILQ